MFASLLQGNTTQKLLLLTTHSYQDFPNVHLKKGELGLIFFFAFTSKSLRFLIFARNKKGQWPLWYFVRHCKVTWKKLNVFFNTFFTGKKNGLQRQNYSNTLLNWLLYNKIPVFSFWWVGVYSNMFQGLKNKNKTI